MRSNDGSRTGGEILVDQLVAHGVDHAFCVPGESYLAALDAFHDRAITLTVCRQEGGAAMMAEAVGKATGRPGICFVTRGPGATNASPGIHIAMQDSTPMIVFVGQVARDMREREAFQELDYRAVFGTMAKWATEIDDPARIPEIVSRAFHVATNGRPGPVVIALPEDMLIERAVVADAPGFEPIETWPGLTDMSRLQKMLWSAQRPIMILGGSRWSDKAWAATPRFAERFDLPVVTTLPPQASVRSSSPELRAAISASAPIRSCSRASRLPTSCSWSAARMGEMPTRATRCSTIPKPQQTFVHVHPGIRTSSAASIVRISRSTRRRRPSLRRSKGCSRRTISAGRARPGPRMRTTSPGPRQPTDVPGAGQPR